MHDGSCTVVTKHANENTMQNSGTHQKFMVPEAKNKSERSQRCMQEIVQHLPLCSGLMYTHTHTHRHTLHSSHPNSSLSICTCCEQRHLMIDGQMTYNYVQFSELRGVGKKIISSVVVTCVRNEIGQFVQNNMCTYCKVQSYASWYMWCVSQLNEPYWMVHKSQFYDTVSRSRPFRLPLPPPLPDSCIMYMYASQNCRLYISPCQRERESHV